MIVIIYLRRKLNLIDWPINTFVTFINYIVFIQILHGRFKKYKLLFSYVKLHDYMVI